MCDVSVYVCVCVSVCEWNEWYGMVWIWIVCVWCVCVNVCGVCDGVGVCVVCVCVCVCV